MIKWVFILFLSVILTGCITKKEVEIVEKIVTEEVFITLPLPEELLVCAKPPIVNPNNIKSEADYNTLFVGPLYYNNQVCYSSIIKLKEFYNKQQTEANNINSKP